MANGSTADGLIWRSVPVSATICWPQNGQPPACSARSNVNWAPQLGALRDLRLLDRRLVEAALQGVVQIVLDDLDRLVDDLVAVAAVTGR